MEDDFESIYVHALVNYGVEKEPVKLVNLFALEDVRTALKRQIQVFDPIDKFINQWLADSNQNFLAILGEYGTGKTTLGSYIAHELAQK